MLFPERRQFFLEGDHLFNASLADFLQPFFRRRIGLDDSNRLPLDAGLRLTHQDSESSYEVNRFLNFGETRRTFPRTCSG